MNDDQRTLVRIEAELRSVENELQRLLQKQEKLMADRDAVRSRLSKRDEQQSASAGAGNVLARSNLEKNDFPWSRKLMTVLKDIFGLSELRPFQLPTINALMNRQDCILIMPTGGGKSLCFQLPALLLDGVTLVVSPLVSLMEDQVMALKGRGVQAEMLCASVPAAEQRAILRAMTESGSRMKILYVTPERMKKSKTFMTNLEKMYSVGRLAHFVVDEVHCCSQWGHDFRPDYKVLGILKGQFPDVPILGLTATATTAITVDVKKMLDIENCLVFRASFNRPNLTYKVMSKTSSAKETVAELAKLIRSKYDGQSGIVYCFSTKESDDLAHELCVHGIGARSYHASLAPEERSKVHRDWLANRCQIVVATVAFGMGIDKPDVRFVIHHSISKSMENFYQESGRAGRDGNPADCIVFFRLADIFRLSSMVFQDKTGLSNLYSTVAFCIELKRCRRAVLADHFGERWDSSICNKKCDICNVQLAEGGSATRTTEMTDVTEHFVALIEIIKKASKINKSLTALQLMDAWLGKGSSALRSNIPSPSLPRTECERLFANLLVQEYFKEKFHFTNYSTISYIIAGSRASQVLVGKAKIMMDVLMSTRKAAPTARTATSAATKSNLQAKDAWLIKSSQAPPPTKANRNVRTASNNSTTRKGAHSDSKAKEKGAKQSALKVGYPDDEDFEDFDFGDWNRGPESSIPPSPHKDTAPVKNQTKLSTGRVVSSHIDLTESSPEDADDEPVDQSMLTADINWDEDVFGESFSSSAATPISKMTTTTTSEALPVTGRWERLNLSSTSVSSRASAIEPKQTSQEESKPTKTFRSQFMFKSLKRNDVVDKSDPKMVAKRLKL